MDLLDVIMKKMGGNRNAIEKKNTSPWYTTLAIVLAQLVWKSEFSEAVKKATAS